jgi:hypothetical protein
MVKFNANQLTPGNTGYTEKRSYHKGNEDAL